MSTNLTKYLQHYWLSRSASQMTKSSKMWLKTVILPFLVLNTRSTDGKVNQLPTEGSQLDSNPSKPSDNGEEGVFDERDAKTHSLEEMQTFDEFGWPTTPDPNADFSTEGCSQNL